VKHVWLARAGRKGEREEFLIEVGALGSGWEEIPDLSGAESFEEIRTIVESVWPDESQRRIGIWAGQLWSLRSVMQPGDLVLMPRKGLGVISIGVITGPYRYDASADPARRHLRSVDWKVLDAPRTAFGQDLRWSLGALMTFCRVQREGAAERIEALMAGRPDPGAVSTDGPVDALEEPDIESVAEVSIQEMIRHRFPGHDLSALVEEVLKANGYETRLSPPGPDQGVDVLAARGGLGFEGPRIAVQVKNTGSAQGVPALNELLGAQSAFGADRALFVSWAGFTSEAARMARTKWFELRLWSADELVHEITAVYDQLPEVLRAKLPLKQVWTVATDEDGS